VNCSSVNLNVFMSSSLAGGPKKIVPAGMNWHDEDGNESGGLALAQVPGWRDFGLAGGVRRITFDFTHQIKDAVRVGTYESSDGSVWRARNENAGLVVHDPEGRERVRRFIFE
jgi:hypothetical protein